MASMAWPSWLSLPPPNDARPRPSSPSATSPQSSAQSTAQTPVAPEKELTLIQRNRSLAILLFGSAMVLLSTRATRRAMIKRHQATKPTFYHQSNEPPQQGFSGPFEAVEALSLASINVASWAMVWAGGVLWAFDINSPEDMKKKVRGGLGIDGTGQDESEAEKEIEKWVATMLNKGGVGNNDKEDDQ